MHAPHEAALHENVTWDEDAAWAFDQMPFDGDGMT